MLNGTKAFQAKVISSRYFTVRLTLSLLCYLQYLQVNQDDFLRGAFEAKTKNIHKITFKCF